MAGAALGKISGSAAETDATKRAFTTFWNLFGLALYDKEQNGMQRSNTRVAPVVWTFTEGDQAPQSFETPQQFCSAAKKALRQASSTSELEALWTVNTPVVAQLRIVRPELRTRNGIHYANLLEGLYRQQRDSLNEQPAPSATTAATLEIGAAVVNAVSSEAPMTAPEIVPTVEVPAANSEFLITMPKRIRDTAHLKYVAPLPCLICGRTPSHAHHLRFSQP